MDIREILDRDDTLASIEEVREVVANRFADLDILVLMWETTEGEIHHRAYGSSTDIVGLLAKAQYIILRQTTGDTEGLDGNEI